MSEQLARGLWTNFPVGTDPFSEPNAMSDNLRLLDDHLGMSTVLPPQDPETPYPADAANGDGQIYSDGTYAIFNAGLWVRYPARSGIRACLNDGSNEWTNTGEGWVSRFSEVSEEIIANFNQLSEQINSSFTQLAEEINTSFVELAEGITGPGGAAKVGFGARTVEDKLRERISIVDHGASPAPTNSSAAVQAAINAAIENGITEIDVPKGEFAVPDALTNRSNVVFVGDGKLTGAGVYRRQVIPRSAAGPTPFVNLIPTVHLSRFLAKASPVVVLMGDSISTEQPNSLDQSSTLWAALTDKIRTDNPGKTITFLNRAIGGLTWAEANGVAWTNWPDWYANHARAWLDYVGDAAPDLIVFAFGMNDAYQSMFDPEHVNSVVAKVKAWAKVPDIVFVTTPVPTLEPHADYAWSGTRSEQEGRDLNAGWTRSYADYHGYGYLDVNRMCNMARDGRDILTTNARRVVTAAATPTGAYIAPAEFECRDFSLRAAMSASAFGGASTLAVRIGARTNDVVMMYPSAGKVRLDFYYTSSLANFYFGAVTDVALPVADFELQVEKRGNMVTVSFSHDARTSAIVRQKIITNGGVFKPSVGWYDNQYASGPLKSLVWLNQGIDAPVKPTLTNDELWGVSDVGAGTKLPFGGNGINHPTSMGFAKVYESVIKNTRFGS